MRPFKNGLKVAVIYGSGLTDESRGLVFGLTRRLREVGCDVSVARSHTLVGVLRDRFTDMKNADVVVVFCGGATIAAGALAGGAISLKKPTLFLGYKNFGEDAALIQLAREEGVPVDEFLPETEQEAFERFEQFAGGHQDRAAA